MTSVSSFLPVSCQISTACWPLLKTVWRTPGCRAKRRSKWFRSELVIALTNALDVDGDYSFYQHALQQPHWTRCPALQSDDLWQRTLPGFPWLWRPLEASLPLILLLLIFPTGISIASRGQNELGMAFQLSGLHAELGEVRAVLKAALSLFKMRKQGVSTPN